MADAEQTLRNLLDTILNEKNYKPREVQIQPVTSGGANFTSALFLIEITSPNHDDLKLFAKVAIVGDNMRIRWNADWLFDNERFVYTKLANIYKHIEDTYNVPDEHRYVFPKFYGYNAEFGKESIVMENLIENGYQSYDRFRSMDWEHASIAIENLAKFHALSFAFAKIDPEEFKKLSGNMKYKIGSTDQEEEDEALKAFWENMIQNAVEHAEVDQKDAVRSFMLQKPSYEKYYKPIDNTVIAHGDYRMSNLLFRERKNKLEVITVDFQTIYAGRPTADLIYFIFLGSDEKFRKDYFEQLLDHYYESLVLALGRLSLNPAEVYPRTNFDRDIKETLPVAILLGVGILPMITADTDSAPKTEGEADMKDFMLKSNELYVERFRGIINDCIRLGAI